MTGDANIGILIHGTDSEAALNILPIGVYGCPVEKPSVMHVRFVRFN